ncbi:MAG: hypothetical protein EOM88_04825 [Clostridia bacterium]|nr:hypothetical protein [Clostridia bacterium]
MSIEEFKDFLRNLEPNVSYKQESSQILGAEYEYKGFFKVNMSKSDSFSYSERKDIVYYTCLADKSFKHLTFYSARERNLDMSFSVENEDNNTNLNKEDVIKIIKNTKDLDINTKIMDIILNDIIMNNI